MGETAALLSRQLMGSGRAVAKDGASMQGHRSAASLRTPGGAWLERWTVACYFGRVAMDAARFSVTSLDGSMRDRVHRRLVCGSLLLPCC